MEMKLELVAIPVTDVDRARDFYKDKLGFNLDHDHTVSEKLTFCSNDTSRFCLFNLFRDWYRRQYETRFYQRSTNGSQGCSGRSR